MKFQESYDFDYRRDVILRMFTDREYYVRKYRRLGGQAPDIVACDSDANHFSITVRHALDVSRVRMPDFVKARIGEQLILRQTDSWTPNRSAGRIAIDIERAPATVAIALHLNDRGDQSRLMLDFDIKVSIPLIGGRVEKAIAGPMTRHLLKNLEVSNELAAAYAG